MFESVKIDWYTYSHVFYSVYEKSYVQLNRMRTPKT